MAGDAANIVLGAIIEKAITPVVNVIGRQLGYLFCYKSYIKNLAETAAQLEKSGNDADNYFKGKRRNNEEPAQSSVGWLEGVEKVIKDAEEVKKSTDKFKGCLNLKGRYVLSRKSAKLAVDIQKLQSKAPVGITTSNILPAGSLPGALANESSKGYKSRMQTLDAVMEALEDPAISVIGICGLGGVGKTTMVHEVRERARNQNLFDDIAMSTVTQTQDLFKIQGDLAEMLGLKALKEEKNVIARADQLLKRLAINNKVLIILDDVWSDINLKDVGIPFGSEHMTCKVLITSRQKGVCTDIQKSIELQALGIEEARALFRKTAGEHVEKKNLGEIADEVADECGGLPISLLTLSKALSDKDRKAWEDARTQLREGHFTSINGMERYVYQSIKLSYDFLAKEKQEEAQLLLLLCCQHQEDAEINVEKLARYCLSLDLFEGVTGVVRARNRVYSLVEHLKSCFLLQAIDADDKDGEWGGETVKVHDVVRDVCLSIVSRMKEERDRVCMHIWNEEDDAVGVGSNDLDYQKLKLLTQVPLHHADISGIKSILEQTQALRVLENADPPLWVSDMVEQNVDSPLAPQFLTNLRMLSLEHLNVRPDVMSEFIWLTKLKILSLMGSTILSFPHQIGQLSELKLLDLRCKYTKREPVIPIPSGILPKLTKLEVLFMGTHYFLEAGGEGDVDKERCSGGIEELDSLTNLTTLQVDLLDPMQLLDLKCFRFDKLEGFSFGSVHEESNFDIIRNPLFMKSIRLKEVKMNWILEDKIQSIVRSTVDLSLVDIEDFTDASIFKQFASLRKLVLTGCHQLEYIIHDGSSNTFINMEILKILAMKNVRELCHNGNLPAGLLHKLQLLDICYLPEMRHLWVGYTDPLCLVNLKVVKIKYCGELEFIFPYSAAKCLSQLQKLTVRGCRMLVGIVSGGGGEENSTGRGGEITEESNDFLIHFPKLTHVSIDYLPNLRGFYNLDDDAGQFLFNPLVMLPSIEALKVWELDSIKAVFDFKGLEAMTMREDARSLLCKLQKIALKKLKVLEHLCRQVPKDVLIFQNLTTLKVDDCGGLDYLIPSSIARMLVNIKKLIVLSCRGMKEVICKMNEEEDCGGMDKKIVFHSLRIVRLEDLKNLLSFCSSDQQVFEFPLLEELSIIECPEIETFCCQIPRVAHSGMLEENVSKGEGTTTEGGEIKKDPSDLVALFPKLKVVDIKETPNFRGFYNIGSYKGHQKMVNLEVRALYKLKQMVEVGGDNLVSVAASSSLNLVQNLKHLILEKCEATKALLDFEGFEVTREDAHSVFNRLETIWLKKFSNLEHICRLIPKEINGFQNLISLHVYGCHSLSYLLTSTMAHMLLNLKFLVVSNCKSMKEIIIMNEDCGEKKIVFSSLLRCVLSSKKLSSFCSSELQEFDFPSLNHVYIVECPKMKTFCCVHLTAEKLRGVFINIGPDSESDDDSDDYIIDDDGSDYNDDVDNVFWKGDINETLRHFNSRANRVKSDPEEDGVHDDGADESKEEDGDDANENTPHLNARVTQVSSHVREDDVHFPEEGVDKENNQFGNEATSSKPTRGLSAPLVGSSPDFSSVPVIVSTSPPISDNDEELAYSQILHLRIAALPRVRDIIPSPSTEQSVYSSDSLVQHFNASVKANANLNSDLEKDDIDDSAATDDDDDDEDAVARDVDGSDVVSKDVDYLNLSEDVDIVENASGDNEEMYEAIARDEGVLGRIIEPGSSSVHIPFRSQACKVVVSEGKQPNEDKLLLGLGNFSITRLTDKGKDEIIKILTQRLDAQQMEMQQLLEQMKHQQQTHHQLLQTKHQLSQTQHHLSVARLVGREKDEIIENLTQQLDAQKIEMQHHQSGNSS